GRKVANGHFWGTPPNPRACPRWPVGGGGAQGRRRRRRVHAVGRPHLPPLRRVRGRRHPARRHPPRADGRVRRRRVAQGHAPPRGPCFVDVPVDQFFDRTPAGGVGLGMAEAEGAPARSPDPDALARVAKLLADAERPVIMAGAGVYWEGAEAALEELAEAAG